MSESLSRVSALVKLSVCAAISAAACWAATFGTVVPVRGLISDISLDETRGRLYAANFSAYRVEVLDLATQTLQTSIRTYAPPSAIGVSADNRYLVVGEYAKWGLMGEWKNARGGLQVIDLTDNSRRRVETDAPVLALAFGADGLALVVTHTQVFTFNPVSLEVRVVEATSLRSRDLPVQLVTFPPQIIQASISTSQDRQKIVVLAGVDGVDRSSISALLRFDVATRDLSVDVFTSTPPLGPRAVSVNPNGEFILDGWSLERYIGGVPYQWAQFPAAIGDFEQGGHAWDASRNVIYAQIPSPGEDGVMHIVDTDNLTVRERIQLRENLMGRSIMSADESVMYAISQSGVMILPVGRLPQTPRLSAVQEDVLFTADACNRLVLKQGVDILALGSVPADFTLSLPQGTQGVTLSTSTGTTPARVEITIDPALYQSAKGTTAIPLTITSSSGVNLPPQVRLLINTRDFDQRGRIVNIPGKLVDMLADPGRSRLYLIRQDKNLVLVYDMVTLQQIGSMRTGNTPVHMAMTTDGKQLIVGNDNSQIASVLDLDTVEPINPILMPGGHYPRAIGVAQVDMFVAIRPAGEPVLLDYVDFQNFNGFGYRTGFNQPTLGGSVPSIFENGPAKPDSVIAASPGNTCLLLVAADGTTILYDSAALTWVVSRGDYDRPVIGAYHAFSDNLFLAGKNLLNTALTPAGNPFGQLVGDTSGAAELGGVGLLSVATTANTPGVIYRFTLTTQDSAVLGSTAIAEAPLTPASMAYPRVGQIGQTIHSSTRTLAVSPDQSTVFALTISGLTVLPGNFYQTGAPPQITSVVNSADKGPGVALGGAIDVNGFGLAPASVASVGFPLPSTLGEVCVTVNNIALPLFSVASSKIAAQLPFNVFGEANLVARGPGGISAPFPIVVRSTAPAIFHTATAGELTDLPAVYRDDNAEPLAFTNPIHPNTKLTILVTGLGTTTPLPALGAAAPESPRAVANAQPTVTLGGQNLFVTAAELVPGLATVYQIKATVPDVVQPGRSVPLMIQSGGASTSMTVRVVTP